jgi:hypothetical protein
MQLDAQELANVNAFCQGQENKYYLDKEAAKERLDRVDGTKADLESSPFVQLFEYGANKNGYWNYQWMVLQLEDCIDVLQSLYPQFDYLFMFDHSCGHDKMRPNGLSAAKLRKGFGGSQPRMRDTHLENEDHFGTVGMKKVELGGTQCLVFQSMDQGPCWMSAEEQHNRREDKESGEFETYTFVKTDLMTKLQSRNLQTTGIKKDLQQRCTANGIATSERRPKIIEGWLNKPKGMLQVLWERGFIDSSIPTAKLWDSYSLGNKQDQYRNEIKGSGLKDKVAVLPDFEQEKTLLQHHAESRSSEGGCQIYLIRSPKCHPELAGEGIEYSWAAAKIQYRRLKLKDKGSKAKFTSAVEKCLGEIAPNYCRSFSKRAREYMIAYDTLQRWEEDPAKGKLPPSSAHLLDKVVSHRKSHRSVSHDGSWVVKLLEATKERPT